MYSLDLIAKTDGLKKLIAENPDLPIVVIAGQNATDGEQSAYCSDISFYIGEILDCEVPYTDAVETDRDNFNEKIAEWLWESMENSTNGNLSDDEFTKALIKTKAEYNECWIKVICINADN